MSLFRRIAALFLLGSLAVLAACSGSGGGEPKVVRIISSGKIIQGKYSASGLTGIVDSDGWLRKALEAKGWKLEFVNMPHAIGGPMINEGFANNSLEFANYGDLPAVIGAGGGAPLRLVLSDSEFSNTYLLVPPEAPYRSIKDLKGKRIALHRGRPWEVPFAHLAEANGLSISDFKIINVNPSAGAAALAAGKVDAYVGTVADTYRLTSKKAGRILWSTKQAPPEWAARTEIWGRKNFVAEHPDVATLVAAAFIRAAKWASEDANRDAYIKLRSRETPEAAIRADLDNTGAWKDRFAPTDPASLKTHYRYIIDYAVKTGLVQQAPSLDDLTDTSLLPDALKLADAEGFWSTKASAKP